MLPVAARNQRRLNPSAWCSCVITFITPVCPSDENPASLVGPDVLRSTED